LGGGAQRRSPEGDRRNGEARRGIGAKAEARRGIGGGARRPKPEGDWRQRLSRAKPEGGLT
jgi:hypothetical protein